MAALAEELRDVARRLNETEIAAAIAWADGKRGSAEKHEDQAGRLEAQYTKLWEELHRQMRAQLVARSRH